MVRKRIATIPTPMIASIAMISAIGHALPVEGDEEGVGVGVAEPVGPGVGVDVGVVVGVAVNVGVGVGVDDTMDCSNQLPFT